MVTHVTGVMCGDSVAHTANISINLNLGGGFKANYRDLPCGGGKGGV